MAQNQPPEHIDRIPTVPLPPLRRRRKKSSLLVLLIPCTCPLLFCMVGALAYGAEALFKGNHLFPILVYMNTTTTRPLTPTSVVITPTSTLHISLHINTATTTPPTLVNAVITPTP